GTLVAVTAVRGSVAELPCDIDAPKPEDPTLIVLWYKNTSDTPFYSYDIRRRSSSSSSSSSSSEVSPSSGNQGAEPLSGGRAVGEDVRAFFNVSSAPAHLQLSDAQGTDEGVYRCKVHFKASPSWSQRIQLTITDPPWFPGLHDSLGRRLEGDVGPYQEGANLKITCTAKGSPPPLLVWSGGWRRQAGETQHEVGGGAVGVSRSVLELQVSRAHADTTISCSTTNASYTLMHTVTIKLKLNLAPVEVTLSGPSYDLNAGVTATFTCRVVGAWPSSRVQWWLAGKQFNPHTIEKVLSANVSEWTLHLSPEPGDHMEDLACRGYSANLPDQVLNDTTTLVVKFVPVAVVSVSADGSISASGGRNRSSSVSSPSGQGVGTADGTGGARKGSAGGTAISGGGTSVAPVYATVGGNISFNCDVNANPPVNRVMWFH
ncbi:unnamed protein product, partial [Meganyctiphanes norvegica]